MSPSVQKLLAAALAFHQGGQLEQAEKHYRAILKDHPNHPDVLNLSGVLALQTNRPKQALRLLVRAVEEVPHNPQFHYNLASAHKQLGDAQSALAAFQHAVTLKPDYVEAHNNLGNLYQAADEVEAALNHYDAAIAHKPNFLGGRHNRAGLLSKLGRFEEALADLDHAIGIAPKNADLHSDRSIILQKMLRYDAALQSIEQALALSPKSARFHGLRGVVLVKLNRLRHAKASFEAARAIDPKEIVTNSGYARLLIAVGDRERALSLVETILTTQPKNADALAMRGGIHSDLHRYKDAVKDFDAAMKLDPSVHFIAGKRILSKLHLGDWSNFTEDLMALIKAIDDSGLAATPFSTLSLIDDANIHLATARATVSNFYPRQDDLGPFKARRKDGKIRLGYFSADYRQHPMGQLLAELFEVHDRTRFEVIAFSFGPATGDDMHLRLQKAFDRFIDVRDMGDREVAALSRELGIDIAIDLIAHTAYSRLGMFALGCAPVQVNFLGYPGTSGAEYIDYIIGDDIITPHESHGHYSEQIVAMPHCYQVNDSKRQIATKTPTRAALGLPEDAFVFCCFNSGYKILPEVFDGWCRIMLQVKNSVLWLLASNPEFEKNLCKEAERRGVDSSRVIFAKREPLDVHLARYRAADLFLDTRPYNAHTTASDALWAGLPVLTRIGRSFPARVAASILRAVDLPELVTETDAEYEALAIALANEPERLNLIRQKLAANGSSSPLFSGEAFARNIEKAYIEMIARNERGESPSFLRVSP